MLPQFKRVYVWQRSAGSSGSSKQRGDSVDAHCSVFVSAARLAVVRTAVATWHGRSGRCFRSVYSLFVPCPPRCRCATGKRGSRPLSMAVAWCGTVRAGRVRDCVSHDTFCTKRCAAYCFAIQARDIQQSLARPHFFCHAGVSTHTYPGGNSPGGFSLGATTPSACLYGALEGAAAPLSVWAWHGVAWSGVAWRGVAWRGVGSYFLCFVIP